MTEQRLGGSLFFFETKENIFRGGPIFPARKKLEIIPPYD